MSLLARFFESSTAHHDLDDRRRSNILLNTTRAILAFNLIVSVALFGPLDAPQIGWATAIAFLVGSMVFPALKFFASLSIAGNILLCQTWALLHILADYAGKIQGVPPAWIIFLPILAIHTCNRFSGVVWTVLAVVEIFVVAWLADASGELVGGSMVLYLATHLGLLTLMVVTAFANENFKDRTLNRLFAANVDLAKARDLALEANRAKSVFVANMSHELRTPLNAVIGYADLLAEDVASVKPEELTQDLQRIKNSGEHLLRLINQLLDFSRLEAGGFPLTIEPFKVEGLIRELVQTMEKEALKNGNTLSFVDSTELEYASAFATDVTKLRQCLYNLIANACKFTSNGHIHVGMSRKPVASPPGDSVVVEVEDDGIGMTPEQLDRVFEPFVQAEESIARRFGGTGLGLSLSRRLAEALGGSLEGYSQEGRGSTFVLIIPNLIGSEDEELISSP